MSQSRAERGGGTPRRTLASRVRALDAFLAEPTSRHRHSHAAMGARYVRLRQMEHAAMDDAPDRQPLLHTLDEDVMEVSERHAEDQLILDIWSQLLQQRASAYYYGRSSEDDLSLMAHPFADLGEAREHPLAEEQIAALPRMRMSEHRECCVCQDRIHLGEQATKLPCGHFYHPDCIGPWLRRQHTCPTCRADVVVCLPLTDDAEKPVREQGSGMTEVVDESDERARQNALFPHLHLTELDALRHEVLAEQQGAPETMQTAMVRAPPLLQLGETGLEDRHPEAHLLEMEATAHSADEDIEVDTGSSREGAAGSNALHTQRLMPCTQKTRGSGGSQIAILSQLQMGVLSRAKAEAESILGDPLAL